jgi:hypothetical protein
MRRRHSVVLLVGAVLVLAGACGSGDHRPLVGTWTYSGSVPDFVTLALTFNANGTFAAVEQVAPFSIPAGEERAPGCATTDSYSGSYESSDAGGQGTVTWTYDTGTVNAVLGCDDASLDMPGTAATSDVIASYTAQNTLPPATEAYVETQATLVLTPGFGRGTLPTTFTRSR